MKILCVLAALLFSLFLFAHGPSSIEMSFNDSLDVLYVKVFHSVKSTSSHYINSIKLFVNGKEVSEHRFKKQSNKEFEETIFLYRNQPAETLLEVSATCNIAGSKKEKLLLGGGK